jgi:small subunit ribosomal protein S16
VRRSVASREKSSIFADLKKTGRDPTKQNTMAVKIRLARRGRTKLAMFDVVVADARAPRDGRFIEKIGTYNPLTNPATINLNEEKAFEWLMNGAQPTDTVKAMLSYRGIMLKKHLQIGVIKGAITQDQADSKLTDWVKSKEAKVQSKLDTLAKSKADSAKARREAETKVKEARAEAIRKKQEVAAAAAQPAAAEGEAPAAEAEAQA